MTNPTSNYGFVMPTPTDLVTDLPADFEVFGQDVDSQMKTNADAATQKATLTTTGDIYYASGAGTPARLGIGTTAQVLTVSGGLPAWSNSTGQASMLNPKLSASYSSNASTSVQSFTLVLNRTNFYPTYITSGTFDRIAIRTSATHSGTTSVRLGLYNASVTTGLPTTVAFDAGTVSCTAASTLYTITISQTPASGWYWVAANAQSISGTASFFANSLAPLGAFSLAQDLSAIQPFLNEDSISGAFATAGTLTRATNTPVVGLRNA